MAQKVKAHCWYELNHGEPFDPEWVIDDEEDDRRLHHPDLMTVVQWGDREPGDGIGDYAPYITELERVKDCIKFPLPYLPSDEKISYIDEARSRLSAIIHELETERAKAVAQMAADQCAVCCNDDDGVSALQRYDGPGGARALRAEDGHVVPTRETRGGGGGKTRCSTCRERGKGEVAGEAGAEV